MHSAAECVGLREGAIYLDLDGTPVRLVRVIGDVCCWVVSGKHWNERQHTLIIHFAKRFRFDSEATARARRHAAHERTSGRKKVSTGLGTYILPLKGTPTEQRKHFRVGERVPQSGIYRAMHESDDVANAVILLAGSVFPYCARCGIDVDFEFAVDVPTKMKYADFHLQTLEIQHPELGSSIDDVPHL